MSLGGVSSISRSTRRIEGIHAGVGQIARGLGWLLGEAGHETARIDVHHTAARRVLGAEHGQRCLGMTASVEIDQGSQVEVRQVVGVDRQEELFVLDPGSVMSESPRTAQELWLEGCPDGRRPVSRLYVLRRRGWAGDEG